MSAQQLPVPNIVELQDAINGIAAAGNAIAQNVQTYNAHQQAFTAELSLCANYNVAQIQQQLTAMQASIADLTALTRAEYWNLKAQMKNAKVNDATEALVAMRSIDQSPNPQVPINHVILNFPPTPDAVSEMTVLQCRDILTALDSPIPQDDQAGERQFQTAVREAVGLAAL